MSLVYINVLNLLNTFYDLHDPGCHGGEFGGHIKQGTREDGVYVITSNTKQHIWNLNWAPHLVHVLWVGKGQRNHLKINARRQATVKNEMELGESGFESIIKYVWSFWFLVCLCAATESAHCVTKALCNNLFKTHFCGLKPHLSSILLCQRDLTSQVARMQFDLYLALVWRERSSCYWL